jgi:predicted transcriptional regulator
MRQLPRAGGTWQASTMKDDLTITPELRARIDAIAARSQRSASEIVAEALVEGHSLAWQEYYLDKVGAGLAAADRGDFATPEEVAQVLNRYRPT